MDPSVRARFDRTKIAPRNWDPVNGGKRAWICFDDSITEDLGTDPDGAGFALISARMLNGHYYPPDAVQYFCEAIDESRDLEPGDRVLQFAPMFPFGSKLGVWQTVEIYTAQTTGDVTELGYVTTASHHGRGIWKSVLERKDGHLKMTVTSTTSPSSWLFWLGLPYARFLQLRARRRAIEEFRKLLEMS